MPDGLPLTIDTYLPLISELLLTTEQPCFIVDMQSLNTKLGSKLPWLLL